MSVQPSATAAPSTGGPYNVASLYVGDLNSEVTEAMLFEKFSAVGPVLSIRVCRDVQSRRSLGYAYVNFQNSSDAQTALLNMNFDDMKGRPMRIMWSQRDPSLRRSGKNNVFIKNLDKSIDNRALYDIFHSFGPILSCKVAEDDSGTSRGYGFVHFESEDSAKDAIERVDGMLLNDRKVYVGPFIPRKERMKNRDTTTFTNIYVKNFDPGMSDDELRELFEAYGTITSCKIMRKDDGTSRGFGFCAFQDSDAADAAVKRLNETEQTGKKLYVARAQKRAERDHELQKIFHQKKAERQRNYQGVNLYIKNLDEEMTDEDLKTAFMGYGSISSAKVMTDDKGVSKGFGFVCFASPEDATKAVTEMNNRMIGRKPLYVALAQRKDERKAQLAQQMMTRGVIQPPMRMPPGQQPMPVFPPMYMQLPPGAVAGSRPFIPSLRPQRAAGNWNRPGPPFLMGGTPGQPFMPHGTMPMHRAQRARNPGRTSNQQQRSGQRGNRGTPSYAQAHPTSTSTAQSTEGIGIDTEKLARSTPQEQKQLLGERLFPKVREIDQFNSGKITGMLLEIDNSEILHMLESKESLRAKVEEAMEVLKAHQANGVADTAVKTTK